ncbi:MAG: hypothetical protein HY791_23135 [Deltaproteobacteria bacterium]|nr:hypothetical protein [Deltaproteobacteria bacterium]
MERVEGEVLVMKTASEEAHALNMAAGAVFDLCDGSTSVSKMAEEVQRRTGLPPDEGIVGLALSELADAGLVTVAPAELVENVSRRALIRRLGLTATAAAMLPIVETILVPSAHAQGSPPPGCTPTFVPSETPSLTPSFEPGFTPGLRPGLTPRPGVKPSTKPAVKQPAQPALVPAIVPVLVPSLTPGITPSLTPSSC